MFEREGKERGWGARLGEWRLGWVGKLSNFAHKKMNWLKCILILEKF